MAQQTAIDYLVNLYYSEYDILLPSEDFAKAKQMEKREAILLLNWILKHYDTHTDSNYMFCWKNPSGQELNSVNLVEQYYNETYGGQGSPDTAISPNTQNK